MILAAGRGTRLAALEPDVPKPLVQIGGEPLLARQLRYLGANGVLRVVVNAHHLSAAIESFAAEYRSLDGPELIVVTEPQLLGTAGGVRNALDQLGSEPFVISTRRGLSASGSSRFSDRESRPSARRASVTIT